MNYTLKALFLALVMFLALDLLKTAGKSSSGNSLKTDVKSYLDNNSKSTYRAFVDASCGDICRK
jgi:hypothetical protein